MKRREPSIAKITRPSAEGIFPRKRLFHLLDRGRDVPTSGFQALPVRAKPHWWPATSTPDIIGEVRRAIGVALDSGKLAMNKDEVLKAVQILIDNQWRMPAAPSGEQAREYSEYPPAVYGEYEGGYEPYYSPEPYYYPYLYYCAGYYHPHPFLGGGFVIRGYRGGSFGSRGFRGAGRGGRH